MTNQLLSEILYNSKQNKSLIGLYTTGIQIDDFCVGYVIDFDESFIVYQHVTKFGQEDGIHIVQIANLEKIEIDTPYIKSCQMLFENPNLTPNQTIRKTIFPFSDSWQFDLLTQNSYIGELIAFQLSGSDYFNFGILIDFDEDHIKVHLVSQSGESEGTSVYNLIDISSFGVDTIQCRKRRCLFNLKNKDIS